MPSTTSPSLGMISPADDHALVADVERGARARPRSMPSARRHVRDCLGTGLAQRVGLRLAPALRDRLREVGEQHGEPQEQRDEPGEDVLVRRSTIPKSVKNRTVVSTLPTSTTNITGLRMSVRGFSFTKLSTIARRMIAGSIELALTGPSNVAPLQIFSCSTMGPSASAGQERRARRRSTSRRSPARRTAACGWGTSRPSPAPAACARARPRGRASG